MRWSSEFAILDLKDTIYRHYMHVDTYKCVCQKSHTPMHTSIENKCLSSSQNVLSFWLNMQFNSSVRSLAGIFFVAMLDFIMLIELGD